MGPIFVAQLLNCLLQLGNDGGRARSLCDIALIVPAELPHRIQEGHKVLYHTVCEWVAVQMTNDETGMTNQ